MKYDKQYLYNAYNATSTGDENGELETYENWLERQLLSRIERLDKLEQVNGDNAKKSNCNIPHVSAMLPDLDIDKAEELAWETDYACFASEEYGNEINKTDAGAFFLEGYNYAKGNFR